MTQIRLGPGHVRLNFDRFVIEPGSGGHRIGLSYEVFPTRLPAGATLFVVGQLRLRQGGASWLGELQPEEHLPISATAVYPRSLVLSTTINDVQLEGLEKQRSGGDVEFTVDLHAALVGLPELDYPAGTAQDWLRIQASDWMAHAERLRALVVVPLLMPLPLHHPDGRRARAGARVQSALLALSDGRFEEAVREARLALELLDEVDPPVPYERRGDRHGLDLSQRFSVLRKAVRAVASGAHHDDRITSHFHYSREDAIAVIACVTALWQRS